MPRRPHERHLSCFLPTRRLSICVHSATMSAYPKTLSASAIVVQCIDHLEHSSLVLFEASSGRETGNLSLDKRKEILKEGNHRMPWEELKSKTLGLIKASEELDSDTIQIKLKALLPRYAPRSFLPFANDDRYESYNIKGEA